MKKPLKSMWILLGFVFFGGLTSGCQLSLGGGTQHHNHSHYQTTRGQELLDLERARDEGVLTDSEYRAQRAKVLTR